MLWSYGVTTTPKRRSDLLPKTLNSLKLAGFDKPRLFIDDCTTQQASEYQSQYSLEVTPRYPTIRAYGNWILAVAELYLRNPQVDMIALFQDDFITYPRLRTYLDSIRYPTNGYFNLYTFPQNQELCPQKFPGRNIDKESILVPNSLSVVSNPGSLTPNPLSGVSTSNLDNGPSFVTPESVVPSNPKSRSVQLGRRPTPTRKFPHRKPSNMVQSDSPTPISTTNLSEEFIGWYPSNQRGFGAVALIFPIQVVLTLLTHQHMVNRPLDAHRGHQSIDGGIVTTMKKIGYTEYVHNPSLVQHIGTISTMGHKVHPYTPSFRGEDFDAMSLFKV